MTTQSQPSGFLTFLKGLFKLILAILLGLIIGAALYMAGSYVYQQAVLPSQNNTLAMENLQNRYTEEGSLLKEKNQQLEERLTQLEIKQADQANLIDELQTQLSQTQSDYQTVLDEKESVLDDLDRLEKSIKSLTVEQKQLAQAFGGLNEQLLAEDEDPQQFLQPLYLELKLLKTMQQINRSRLFILQNNYGMAKQEIELALQFMGEMTPFASLEQQDDILLWQTRLELISSYLPNQPALANEDMEILWQRMAEGFSQPEATPAADSVMEEDSAPTPTEQRTLTPSSTPTQTPPPNPKSVPNHEINKNNYVRK